MIIKALRYQEAVFKTISTPKNIAVTSWNEPRRRSGPLNAPWIHACWHYHSWLSWSSSSLPSRLSSSVLIGKHRVQCSVWTSSLVLIGFYRSFSFLFSFCKSLVHSLRFFSSSALSPVFTGGRIDLQAADPFLLWGGDWQAGWQV